MTGSIAQNLEMIRRRMKGACERAGRPIDSVRLIGVTKTVPVERIREGAKAGITLLGENYVQEGRSKVEALAGLGVIWHFIGHLQSNKARQAVDCFQWIHTVDRESLARALNRHAVQKGVRLSVLLQVNVGDEDSKSGVAPDGLSRLFREVNVMEGLSVRGLMALPPYLDDPEDVRPYFRVMHGLLDRLKSESGDPDLLTELSMGMSHDFEVAIEEGATFIRIGTALFGSRLTSPSRA